MNTEIIQFNKDRNTLRLLSDRVMNDTATKQDVDRVFELADSLLSREIKYRQMGIIKDEKILQPIVVKDSFAQCENCKMWDRLFPADKIDNYRTIPLLRSMYSDKWLCDRCFDKLEGMEELKK